MTNNVLCFQGIRHFYYMAHLYKKVHKCLLYIILGDGDTMVNNRHGGFCHMILEQYPWKKEQTPPT